MSQLEIGFYMLGAILLMRHIGLEGKPGLGRWLLYRMYGLFTFRRWPRTRAEWSWQTGSILPWVSDTVRHDIRAGHRRADAAIEKHHTDKKRYLRP